MRPARGARVQAICGRETNEQSTRQGAEETTTCGSATRILPLWRRHRFAGAGGTSAAPPDRQATLAAASPQAQSPTRAARHADATRRVRETVAALLRTHPSVQCTPTFASAGVNRRSSARPHERASQSAIRFAQDPPGGHAVRGKPRSAQLVRVERLRLAPHAAQLLSGHSASAPSAGVTNLASEPVETQAATMRVCRRSAGFCARCRAQLRTPVVYLGLGAGKWLVWGPRGAGGAGASNAGGAESCWRLVTCRAETSPDPSPTATPKRKLGTPHGSTSFCAIWPRPRGRVCADSVRVGRVRSETHRS